MDITTIFGSGEQLTPLQMGSRAFIMFFITLALIRFGGLRIIGMKTAFDTVIVIMLGAILTRGVIGASPFFSTVAAAVVLIIIHRILAWLSMKSIRIGMLVKGIHHSLYKDGKMNEKNMNKTLVSKDDLLTAVRIEINSDNLADVKEATMEKNGQVSVVKKLRIMN